MPFVVTVETTLSDGAVNNVDISMPAGHLAGDMTVLFLTQDGGATAIANAGGEFTGIGTQGASQAQRTACFYRNHTAAGESDVNFTGAADEWIVTAVLLRGASALSLHKENRTNSANSTSNSLTSGTVTTTDNNCIILSCFGFDGVMKLALDNTSLNKSVNLSKEINGGCVQICQYFNQLTAGATPTLTALSEVQSEGGVALIVAITEATPANALMSPMITQAYEVLRRYGGITTAATNVAAFIRHDAVTWVEVNGGITPSAIDGLTIATIATFTEVAYQPIVSVWGSATGLSFVGSAVDTTGRLYGRYHTVAWNLTDKIFTVEFLLSDINTSRLGAKGCYVYFEDSSGYWAAFQVSRRQRLLANTSYVFYLDVENATPTDAGASAIDWSDIVKVGYLIHKRTTATNAVIFRLKNALLLDRVILVDGCAASPCNAAFIERVLGGFDPRASGGHGPWILATLQGRGQALARFGLQYGDGTRTTVSDLSATSHELPLRADASLAKRFWKVEDNCSGAEVTIRCSAGDVFQATACVIATDVRQNLKVHPSSSASASYDFSGASIINYDITNSVAGVVINGATLLGCSVTLGGGGLSGCKITNSYGRVVTTDPEQIEDCVFTSPGTGHAIEITATGTFDFFGNSFSGYGADGTPNAAIYNNSGGAVELVLQAGNPTPTILNGASASTTISSPPVTIEATILADSRVQLYNVTTDTEIDNVFEATTDYEFIVTTEATVGDTIRLRVCKLGYMSFEAVASFSAAGIGFVVSQVEDEVYTAYGIDGSAVTKFSPDYGNTEIDLDVASNFSAAEFYNWFNYILTTEDGIIDFYGGLTAIDVGNIRINGSVVDLYFDNTTTTNVFQNDNIRIFRSDDEYPVVNPTSGGGGIDLVWRNQVYTVNVGGSALTPTEQAQLSAVATATAEIKKLTGNDVSRSGDVITIYEDDKATPWRGYDLTDGGRVQT